MAGIIHSHPLETAESGGLSGYDEGKTVKKTSNTNSPRC
jgi:hypothetical protein